MLLWLQSHVDATQWQNTFYFPNQLLLSLSLQQKDEQYDVVVAYTGYLYISLAILNPDKIEYCTLSLTVTQMHLCCPALQFILAYSSYMQIIESFKDT